jgi:hypothetical protein
MTPNPQAPICKNPVFVVGSPRSGTSILPWSLHQHSNFWTSRESDLLYNLFGNSFPGEQRSHLDEVFHLTYDRPEGTWLHENHVDKAEMLAYVGMGLNALYTSRSHPKRWVEQTPVNTLMVENLSYLFPGAQFVHILRDGRRVVHSMLHFADRLKAEVREAMIRHGSFPSWATGAAEAARTWRLFVQTARDFEAAHRQRCLTVVNEEMSARPAQGFRRLLEFLGAPYEDAPAQYFITHRINSSFTAATAPAKDAWNQWPSEWRSAFYDEAGELLVKLGFARQQELLDWLNDKAPPAKGTP